MGFNQHTHSHNLHIPLHTAISRRPPGIFTLPHIPVATPCRPPQQTIDFYSVHSNILQLVLFQLPKICLGDAASLTQCGLVFTKMGDLEGGHQLRAQLAAHTGGARGPGRCASSLHLSSKLVVASVTMEFVLKEPIMRNMSQT